MASRIEEDINALQEFIDGCKGSRLHPECIMVDQNELEGYIDNLRTDIPDEIKQYQRIINNQEHILADARKKADAIIKAAEAETDKLVSQHQILQQAYARANELVLVAQKDAESMLDKATLEANGIKNSAMEYTDNNLKIIQDIISASMEDTRSKTDNFLNQMQGYLDIITSNRAELVPPAAYSEENTQLEQQAESLNDNDEVPVQMVKTDSKDTNNNSGVDVPDVFSN